MSTALQAYRPSPTHAYRPRAQSRAVRCYATSSSVLVRRSPPEAELKALGVRAWPTWSCGVSRFPWTYDATEVAFLLEGSVVVTPDGGEPVVISAGDLATFPEGMACVWDVRAPIRKHYSFS